MKKQNLHPNEKRAAFSLASIFAFRMLGLFMILPVFALYADDLKGATPLLIGIALGVYGLTQALLQIPFGMLSDKLGRKPIIAFGLLLFAIGSVVAAMAHSIEGVIIGRALQGAGAVGSTIIALVADLTSDESRTKAMAVIGLTIGIAFTIAMVLGPILSSVINVSGIFWLTALLAIVGMVFLFSWVPTPTKSVFHRDSEAVPALFKNILKDKELLRLDFGILVSHAILMASFVVIPVALEKTAGLPEAHQWYVYLPVLVLAFFAMLPMIIIAEKRRKMKSMFLFSIALIAVAQLLLWLFHSSAISIAILLFIYFTAFTFLEASLPSLISKQASAGNKGTAMGVYSSSQFFGIFLGGALGGWLYGQQDLSSVFLASGILALIWLVFAFSMKQPRYLATRSINIGIIEEAEVAALTDKLLKVKGVHEAAIIAREGIAYLKVDSATINKDELMQYSASH